MEFNLPTIISLGILIIGQIVAIVISIRKPNEDQNVVITRIEATFNERFKVLTEDMLLVKQNHLPHIESSMGEVKERLMRIETILEERLPKKSN